jgi:hypothetical protein
MAHPSPKQPATRKPIAIRTAAAASIDLRILILRHQRVILDTALAELYNVPVKRLNEQVKRNCKRFPADFMFQVTPRENRSLRSQFATANIGRGGRRSLPYAFNEHGAIMAATVLNSKQAVEMSVFVVRAFVRLRKVLSENKEFAERIKELEQHFGDTRWRDWGNSDGHQEAIESSTQSSQEDWVYASDSKNDVVESAWKRYFMRLRYRLPSTCRVIASMSSGTFKNAATSSATTFGSRNTR